MDDPAWPHLNLQTHARTDEAIEAVRREANGLSRAEIGVGLASFAARFINAAARHQPRPHWDYLGIRTIRPDLRVHPEIILEPAGQEAVAVGEDDIMDIWLGYAPASGLIAFRGDDRIGAAGPDAEETYGPAVRAALDDGVTPVILATRRRAADGSVQLFLGLFHGYRNLDLLCAPSINKRGPETAWGRKSGAVSVYGCNGQAQEQAASWQGPRQGKGRARHG